VPAAELVAETLSGVAMDVIPCGRSKLSPISSTSLQRRSRRSGAFAKPFVVMPEPECVSLLAAGSLSLARNTGGAGRTLGRAEDRRSGFRRPVAPDYRRHQLAAGPPPT
jgi:hypothetical protein